MGIFIRHSHLFDFQKIQSHPNNPDQLVYGVCFDVGGYLEFEQPPKCYSYLCCSPQLAGSLYRLLYL
jgi:hypothetical protein